MIDSRYFIAYLSGMKTLSDKMREVIRDSGMSQDEIANAIGISAGILSRFMRAERSMNLATAEKLAKFFQLELREVREQRPRR